MSTDKVDTEIPSPASGTLLEIKVAEDETVEVGTELAVIGSTDGPPSNLRSRRRPNPRLCGAPARLRRRGLDGRRGRDGPPRRHSRTSSGARPGRQAAPAEAAPASSGCAGGRRGGGDGSPYVTPLVRKLATEHSVDLATLRGTGVGGRIRKQDVLAAAEQARKGRATCARRAATAPAAPPASRGGGTCGMQLRGTTVKMSRLRSIIARRMIESLQVSASYDGPRGRCVRDREAAPAGQDRLPGPRRRQALLPAVLREGHGRGAQAHPSVNATIDTEKGEITYFDAEHLGIAVDTDRGLLVPVIRDAGDLNIAGLARKIADLADRTRNNKIMPDELSGGTFTLTNTGSRGVLIDTPIINQPQVGILGTGAVVKRPVVVTRRHGGRQPRDQVDGVPVVDLRPPARRRRGCRPVPRHDQAAVEGGQFEGDLGI